MFTTIWSIVMRPMISHFFPLIKTLLPCPEACRGIEEFPLPFAEAAKKLGMLF
jgi:hypothetical protein